MSNDIQVYSSTTAILTYSDAKGRELAISAEGAIIKGGKVLTGLMKEAALQSAFRKAESGKYRAAADILAVGFPGIGKAVEKLLGAAWVNKTNMASLVGAVARATPAEGKTFNAKAMQAKALAAALTKLPAFKSESTVVTIDAGVVDTPTA